MAKHASVYPAPEELEAVQALVSTVEGALKKVSDWMDGLNKSSGKTSTNSEAAGDKVEEDADTKYVPAGFHPFHTYFVQISLQFSFSLHCSVGVFSS